MNNSLSLEIRKAANRKLCQLDIWEYCLHIDKEFFQKRAFLKIVAYTFQYLVQKEKTPNHIVDFINSECEKQGYYNSGKIPKKAGVSMPPRAGKSYVISVCCSWALGKYSDQSIMRNACTQRLYEKFSYDTRFIMRGEKYQDIFETRLAEDKQALSEWNTDKAKQVSYFGAGVGGTIIGFGASLIAITDDLYKSMIDALSNNNLEKVKMWKESAHDSRLEKNCAELDIGTRWSNQDIIGQAVENKEYDIIIRIPALINEKSFCDDVKSTEEYLSIKAKVQDFVWNAEYMQEPSEAKGSCFPKNRLKRFKLSDIDITKANQLNYTDIADQGTCYLSSGFVAEIEGNYYLTDIVYSQLNTDYTIPAIGSKMEKHQTKKAIFESNGMGLAYTKLFKKHHTDENNHCKFAFISALPSRGDKHMRIVFHSEWILQNVYFLDESELQDKPEYKLFLHHISQYLKDTPIKPSDGPDMLSGIAKYFGNMKRL